MDEMPKTEVKEVTKDIPQGKKLHLEKQKELFEKSLPGEMPKYLYYKRKFQNQKNLHPNRPMN